MRDFPSLPPLSPIASLSTVTVFPAQAKRETPQARLQEGLKRFLRQAEQVNQLSVQLEAAMLELKTIATDLNQDLKSLKNPTPICEYQAASLPRVARKADGSWILVNCPIDLFKAEKDAVQLAQTLRRRQQTRDQKQRLQKRFRRKPDGMKSS